MPTYQYACTVCAERLEAVQKFTDAPLAECPACGGALRKVFSAVGVVFKGSGFYKTDSRVSKASSNGDAATSGSSAPGSSSKDAPASSGAAAPAASSGSGSSSGSSGSGSSSGSSGSSGAAAAAS